MKTKIESGKSVVLEYRTSLNHPYHRAIATSRDGTLSVNGCVPGDAGMVGRTLSQPFLWHTWDGVVEEDGKLVGGYFFDASRRIIATLPDGLRVMHGGEGVVGCVCDGQHFADIAEAVISLIPEADED